MRFPSAEIRKFIPGLVASAVVIAIVGFLLFISMDGQKEPRAEIEVVSDELRVNTEIVFDGTGSTDPDGSDENLIFRWTVDGRDAGSDPMIGHSFSSPGNHTVVLKVVDPTGRSDTSIVSVLIGY